MTEHRTKTLSALLAIALATGHTDESEVESGFEPLKVRSLSNPNHIADLFESRILTPAL
jgi:hypothetical protein